MKGHTYSRRRPSPAARTHPVSAAATERMALMERYLSSAERYTYTLPAPLLLKRLRQISSLHHLPFKRKCPV